MFARQLDQHCRCHARAQTIQPGAQYRSCIRQHEQGNCCGVQSQLDQARPIWQTYLAYTACLPHPDQWLVLRPALELRQQQSQTDGADAILWLCRIQLMQPASFQAPAQPYIRHRPQGYAFGCESAIMGNPHIRRGHKTRRQRRITRHLFIICSYFRFVICLRVSVRNTPDFIILKQALGLLSLFFCMSKAARQRVQVFWNIAALRRFRL